MEHDAETSRRYKENWDDAVQASKADAAEIAELKEAYALLFKDNALLRQVHADFRRECGDTDAILRVLGLDPVNCRTDGGSLKLVMLLGAIEHRDVMLKRVADATIDRLHDRLRQIGDRAHDASTGPAVPDVLWEIRSLAYDGIGA